MHRFLCIIIFVPLQNMEIIWRIVSHKNHHILLELQNSFTNNMKSLILREILQIPPSTIFS